VSAAPRTGHCCGRTLARFPGSFQPRARRHRPERRRAGYHVRTSASAAWRVPIEYEEKQRLGGGFVLVRIDCGSVLPFKVPGHPSLLAHGNREEHDGAGGEPKEDPPQGSVLDKA
jgi:hypothetical protein